MTCPFCEPRPEETIYLSRDVVGLADIRPIMVGHILVAPKSHVGGAAKIDKQAASELERVISLLMETQEEMWGQSACYAHDGPVLCRPHLGTVASAHAHCHVLPVTSDAISRVPADWIHDGSERVSESLLQRLGVSGNAMGIPLSPGRVPPHLVRTLVTGDLQEASEPWIPLSVSSHDHGMAVSETIRATRAGLSRLLSPLDGSLSKPV